jgi:hypothetical protein
MADSGLRVEEDQKEKNASLSPVRENVREGDPSPSSPAFSPNPSTVAVSLAVLVVGALLRTGFINVLLVLLCSA